MDGSSDTSPFQCTEQDTGGDEANRGTLHKNWKHLHQVQRANKRKNKENRSRRRAKEIYRLLELEEAKKMEENLLRGFKREISEMEEEVDDLKSKAAEMNNHMMTALSNVKNQITNQENLVENLLQEPLVQQLVLGAKEHEVFLLRNGSKQCSDGIGELKDRVMMLALQIDVLCRLFLK